MEYVPNFASSSKESVALSRFARLISLSVAFLAIVYSQAYAFEPALYDAIVVLSLMYAVCIISSAV